MTHRLQADRPQHRGPEDRVRLQDVLRDEMLARPPEPRELVPVRVADRRQVVDQRVEPDVADVAPIEGQLDPPVESRLRTRDAQVAETALLLQHREHLVAVALGADELGMVGDVAPQPLEVLGHLEEVVALGAVLRRSLVVATESVHQVAIGQEALAADAVVSLVLAELDLPCVPDPLQDRRHDGLVVRVRGADEAIVGDAERLPGLSKARREVRGRDRRGLAPGLRHLEHLLSVLVAAGQEEGPVATQPVVAGEGVRQHRRVRVADVGLGVHVVDGRRDVVVGGHGSFVGGSG